MERFQIATLSALLTGIAFSAAVIETLGLFTYEKIGFGLLFRRGRMGLLALPLLIFVGPVILLKAAVEAAWRSSAGGLLVVSGLLAALFWAVASGHLLLRIIAWSSAGL